MERFNRQGAKDAKAFSSPVLPKVGSTAASPTP